MVDISSIPSAIQIIKSSLNLINNLKNVSNPQVIEIKEQLLNVQQTLLDNQQNLFELINENEELKKKIEYLNDWEKEKKGYNLDSINGVPFYRLIRKITDEKLCATCFENKKKSHLSVVRESTYKVVHCPTCKYSVKAK